SILRRRIDLILSGRKLIEDDDDEPEVDPDHLLDVRVGDLRIEAESHRVIWRDQHVELTLTEFMLVYRLAVRAGKNVSYRELYDVVHGEGFVAGEGTEGYRANVRTLIKRIRQKFRNMDKDFDEIRNYPGFGYRWRDPDKESGAGPA
ncbi:MAG: winged helix-turn-helix domain-containing protein, partial [Acetobacterales bacterium]